MASVWHCSILLLIVIIAGGYFCKATAEYNILDFNFDMARKHELWMAKYGRVYKDDAEKARRLEIFKENVKYIEDFNNAGVYKFTLGVNQFADLTHEEFIATYVRGVPPQAVLTDQLVRSFNNKTTGTKPINTNVLPTSVDWRAEGAVSPVKNQGPICGRNYFHFLIIYEKNIHKQQWHLLVI